MKDLVLLPRISEKAYGLSETRGVYTFVVPKSSNRTQIQLAVEAQYEVTVTDVNMLNVKGKVKRFMHNRKQKLGNRSDFKKAYVTLKKGDSLPIFAALKEDTPAPEKSKKKAEKK